MSPEAVRNENPWLLIRLRSGSGVEHTFDPLQTDFGIRIPRLGARIMPARGGIRGPVASMGCGWPDDHGKERPTSAEIHSIAVTIVRLTPAPL
jgi:hypothetical protein